MHWSHIPDLLLNSFGIFYSKGTEQGVTEKNGSTPTVLVFNCALTYPNSGLFMSVESFRMGVSVVIWPSCNPDLALTEGIWCIVKGKILQRTANRKLAKLLESYIRQEYDMV